MKGLYKFLIVGFVLAGLASYRSWADGRLNSPPLNSEQLEVYGEFIDSFSRMNFKFLSKKTYPLDLSSLGRDAPCLHGLQFQSATESGKAVHLLGQEVLRGHSIQLVDEQQEASILKQRDEDKPTDSNTSTSDSAGTTKDPGILALSEIVFDKSNHFAVLNFGKSGLPLDGYNQTAMYFRPESGEAPVAIRAGGFIQRPVEDYPAEWK